MTYNTGMVIQQHVFMQHAATNWHMCMKKNKLPEQFSSPHQSACWIAEIDYFSSRELHRSPSPFKEILLCLPADFSSNHCIDSAWSQEIINFMVIWIWDSCHQIIISLSTMVQITVTDTWFQILRVCLCCQVRKKERKKDWACFWVSCLIAKLFQRYWQFYFYRK